MTKNKLKHHPFYVVAGGQVLAGAKSKADAETYAKLHDSDHSKPRHERPAVFSADFVREVLNIDATDPRAWRDPPKATKAKRPRAPLCAGCRTMRLRQFGVDAAGTRYYQCPACARQYAGV